MLGVKSFYSNRMIALDVCLAMHFFKFICNELEHLIQTNYVHLPDL